MIAAFASADPASSITLIVTFDVCARTNTDAAKIAAATSRKANVFLMRLIFLRYEKAELRTMPNLYRPHIPRMATPHGPSPALIVATTRCCCVLITETSFDSPFAA